MSLGNCFRFNYWHCYDCAFLDMNRSILELYVQPAQYVYVHSSCYVPFIHEGTYIKIGRRYENR